ncbi:MAG TPA: heavy-metal-associated domain-containing protein [Gemmataceae bacterium]|jgi:copper chaperone CopZ|nr:heavy-metal-associated domain-containing protein [Gemmataceae bacterium]
MKRLFIAAVAAAAGLAASAGSARADGVEVSGVHLCCGACVRAATQAVSKVDGVSDAKADRPTKKVTFTAKDEATAKAAKAALIEAGFFGTFKVDGKDLPEATTEAKKTDKVAEVTVKNAHICCNACKNAAKGLFKDSTVDFPEKNVIKVTGKDLDAAAIVETLHKAGFGGKVD